MDLLVFWIIGLLYNPSATPGHKLIAGHCHSGFSGRGQNSWVHQLWQPVQVLKQESSPKPSQYCHHIWLLICSFCKMLCSFNARCNGTYTFFKKKNQFFSRQPTEYMLGILKFPEEIWDEPLSSFRSEVAFPLWPYLSILFLISKSRSLTLI